MARPQTRPTPTGYAAEVGAIIRAKRVKKNLSVADAAERAATSAPTWYRWEEGFGMPLEKLPAIAAALGCTPRALLPR